VGEGGEHWREDGRPASSHGGTVRRADVGGMGAAGKWAGSEREREELGSGIKVKIIFSNYT
jgi:hypothetical protein